MSLLEQRNLFEVLALRTIFAIERNNDVKIFSVMA